MVSTSRVFVFIGLLFFSSPFGVLSSQSTVPVLMWSNTNSFSGKNTQDVDIVTVKEINDAMRSESNSLSSYIKKSSPELILLFVEPKLSSEQFSLLAHAHEAKPNGGAFANLKKFVEKAESSLVLPYVTAAQIGEEMASSLKSSINGQMFSFTSEQFKNTLSEGNWAPLSNGVTDVVVVEFDSIAPVSMLGDSSVHSSYANDDVSIASIIKSVGKASYIAVFTSNGADSQFLDSITIAERQSQPRMAYFRATPNYGQNGDILFTTYWPSGIVEALLIMAPFIGILFIGICCTLQIQSDLKFGAEKAILKKQFM